LSFWWYKKEKGGKRIWYAIDIPFPLIVMIVGLFVAVYIIPSAGMHSQFIRNSFYSIAIGYVLLFISKVSLLRQGITTSWGTSQMTKPFKMLYVVGYVLMAMGIIGVIVDLI